MACLQEHMIHHNKKRRCEPMSCSPRFLIRSSLLLRESLPFETDRALLTHMGRNAIWQAVSILGLNPEDEILVPAYNCGSEIDPLIEHGLTIVPYQVSRSARIDFEDMCRRVTQRTRAVYVTHYFGFTQELRPVVNLCREKGLSLIEDCALALFSRNGDGFVGRAGDVAVFSFRKTVPVPDGGAVVINNPGLLMVDSLEKPPLAPVLSALVPMVGRFALRWLHIEWDGLEKSYRLIRSGMRRLIKHKRSAITDNELRSIGGEVLPSLSRQDHYDPKISHWQMSAISRRIIANINPQEIVAKRRANFQYLLEALRGISEAVPLFQQLPEGVCPTVFPLLTERRSEVHKSLTYRRIDTIEWWSGYHPRICWDEFPDAAYLKGNIVALPIHHRLDQDDMAYIAACVREILDANKVDETQA